MAEKLHIDALFAFIAENEEGEGVCGFLSKDGTMMPMVGANWARVESLKPIAKEIAWKTGKTIKLVSFSIREEVETILPYTHTISEGAITCLMCGMTSHNQNDVENLYCGHCRRFHEDHP